MAIMANMAKEQSDEAEDGLVIINFWIRPDLKEKIADAAWSARISRGKLLAAFFEEANFEGWLASKTLKVKPTKVGS